MVEKVREFCNENQVFGFVKECKDPISYYRYFIYINDVTRSSKVRATETETEILAHLIHFIVENGEINGNKDSFETLISFLMKRDVVSGKAGYMTHKNNLINKGYLKKTHGKYTLQLDKMFFDSANKEQIFIFIAVEK